jgi:hypothetical protein
MFAMDLAGNVGDMSATRRNVAYFRADRGNLATWIPVCWHTFVSCFPNIDGPRTDDMWSSVVLIPTLNGNLHNRSPHQQTAQKNHPPPPFPRVASTSRVVASRGTRFVCLPFVCSFGWLLHNLSAPCCHIPSRLVAVPRHSATSRLSSSVSSSLSSRRVVASRLTSSM